mmetsp:Transcript_24906/g.58810  ORF Transcript_24906/g.58810 Transcript_24906/m.58810 type:complete len:336 (-) Transcript_24906:60-1067(-)
MDTSTHPSLITIGSTKSLVDLRENLRKSFLVINEETNSVTQTMLSTMESRKFIIPAFVSPNSSSNDLQEYESKQLQEQSQRKDSSPRPLKKRKIDTAASAPASAAADALVENEAVLRRKTLAAQLRANGVSRRLVLKPSAFARSTYVKNSRSTSPIIDVLPFSDPTSIDIEIHQKYSQKLYNFVRKGTDLEGFKRCVRRVQQEYNSKQTEEHPFRCSNRFGESLLHLTCRRGRTEMVRFLVEEMTNNKAEEARRVLTVRDDCLKTPLHDACWTPSPNFELVELILKHCPEQVLMEDIRGNTPFDYVRKEDYNRWLKFLWHHKSLLRGVSSTVPSN